MYGNILLVESKNDFVLDICCVFRCFWNGKVVFRNLGLFLNLFGICLFLDNLYNYKVVLIKIFI